MLRRFLFALTVSMITSTGCSTMTGHPAPAANVHLWHVVVIRLNHPGDPEAQRKVIAASHDLKRDIPAIQSVSVGKVLPGNRPHQDSNFDVALIMGFRSKEDLEAYEAHPAHVKAVNEILKPLAKDFTSYDFGNE